METLELLRTMKAYATTHKVPIIEQESVDWLGAFLADKEVKHVLEIGSAIGYSTICFQTMTKARVLSIEKDELRFAQAQQFLADFSEQASITLLHGDAKAPSFLEHVRAQAPYDLIFIDATKRNNQYFFESFEQFVKPGGYIITDNLNFRGLVASDEAALKALPRRIRPMVRAINDYRQWLDQHERFATTFIAVGDELAISQKIK